MTANELEQALRALTRRQPFRLFFIEFVSGDRLLVSHPEAVNRYGELFLFRGPNRDQRIFAGASVCQLIDPPPVAPPS
jgi:hypothetical protein